MHLRFVAVVLLAAVVAQAAEIKGKVTNAVGGEALGRVEVSVLETRARAVTSITGEFDIADVAPGSYTLRLNAVGYRLVTVPFKIATPDEAREFSVAMVPDNFHHTDTVVVNGDVFQQADSPATSESNLTSSEIREASTVFADDPFRALQSLPGVSASGNNEFFAEFSVMGAPFSRISIYMDDVLVPSPFHEIGNFNEGASLGVLTSEVVEEMKLLPAAYPEKFGDDTGAALDVHTREGSRGTPLFRFAAGVAASDLLAEGGFGHSHKGSWLVSARKSYVNYLVQNRIQSYTDIGFEDADLKLNYDLSPRQSVSFLALGGPTTMRQADIAALQASPNAPFLYASGKSNFTFSRAGWRFGVTPRLLLEARGAYIRQVDELSNAFAQPVTKDYYHEWVGAGDVSWAWGRDEVLQAGWTRRLLVDEHVFAGYAPNLQVSFINHFPGNGVRQSGYAQQSASFFHGRVHALGSLRWDSLQQIGPQPFSPQISLAIRATAATQLQLAAGRYAQFPDFLGVVEDECGQIGFLPQKSTHVSAAIEHRIDEFTRVRLEAFDRQDALPLGYVPNYSRLQALFGTCHAWQPLPVPGTYARDYARGLQLVLQRRSSNRLSGWLGYTVITAKERRYAIFLPGLQLGVPVKSPFIGSNTPYYPTLEDQRHSLNAFVMYRLKPTVNLSGKFLYGSGFPVPSGAVIQVGNTYELVGQNATRLSSYLRLDTRIDKDWAFTRWKLTLYGEGLNLTNHYNGRYYQSGAVDPSTLKTEIKTLRGLPITPTAGVVFQF